MQHFQEHQKSSCHRESVSKSSAMKQEPVTAMLPQQEQRDKQER